MCVLPKGIWQAWYQCGKTVVDLSCLASCVVNGSTASAAGKRMEREGNLKTKERKGKKKNVCLFVCLSVCLFVCVYRRLYCLAALLCYSLGES
jgi:hypothetical protein